MIKKLANGIRARFLPYPPPLENVPLPYPSVSLYHWRTLKGECNFGDELSHIIVSRILGLQARTLHDQTKARRRMLAIGSVVHIARDGDIIWGSGVNGKIRDDEYHFTGLEVRAVRGPLTADFLRKRGITVPDIFGDPALLLPTLFKDRFKPNPTKPFVIVPNLNDLAEMQPTAEMISPLWGWNRCIEDILSAELVISSSLHGLIVAEAFGVPARFVRFNETENLFKYQDYFAGTGRENVEFAHSIEEALEMGGMPPMQFDGSKLLAAFPHDLWD